MFLLYAANNAFARRARALFSGVFDDIGEIALVDSHDEITAATDNAPSYTDYIIVAFGADAVADAPPPYPILGFLLSTDNRTNHLQNERVLTTFYPGRKTTGDRTDPSNDAINWPIWNAPFVSRFRGRDWQAEKSAAALKTSVLFDSKSRRARKGNDSTNVDGVIFAASCETSTSPASLSQMIAAFVEAFRHNEGAVLRLHVLPTPADRAGAQNVFVNQLKEVVNALGEIACRILVIDAAEANETPECLFENATIYIVADDLTDTYVASGYFSAQVPLIVSTENAAAFGLSSDYALLVDDKKPLSTVFKNAFHIARTAPQGYRRLRRVTIDNARTHFSQATATTRLRRLLAKRAFRDAAPNIDARRQDEKRLMMDIGLYDMTRSGWLNYETGEVAPGFTINKSDIVVDVGCGGGGFSRFASTAAGEVVFCDLNADALERAEKHIAELAACPIRGLLTDGERLDINTEYADKVMCTEVLEHVDNPARVMAELYRIGKPGALYLISAPDTLSELMQKPVAPPQYFEKPNHIRIFERDEFTALVSGAGLDIISHDFRGFYAVFEWLIKWYEDPLIEAAWARLWQQVINHEKGAATKATLDHYIAKSHSIIARKPQ